jgi:hypothetical protein
VDGEAKPEVKQGDLAGASEASAGSTQEQGEPLSPDAMSSGATRALRSLALDTKAEPSASGNRGAQSAELGARMMDALRSDTAQKTYAALAVGINLLGLAKPAAAEVVIVEPYAPDQAGAAQTRSGEAPASSWLTEGAPSGGKASAAPAQAPHLARIQAMTGQGTSASTLEQDNGGLVERAKDKLVEMTWEQLESGVDASGSIDVGVVGVGVRVEERIIRGDASFVTNDPVRAATTERLQQQTGKNVVWLESTGVAKTDFGLSKLLPMSGGVGGDVGFSASATIEYRSLHPHTGSAAEVGEDVWNNHTVRVPTDGAKARALEPGTQVELTGEGRAVVSAGVGSGTSASLGNFTANASAGVRASTARSGTWSVGVTRLADEKVRVVLSEVQGKSAGVTARADASIQVAGDALPGGDEVGVVGGLLVDEGVRHLQRHVRRYTAFHASHGGARTETRTDLTSYVLDLSTPQGRQAYEELVRLDESSARALAETAPQAITRHVYTETANASSENTRVSFAGVKLLLVNALRHEAAGTLQTGGGTELVRTSRYTRSHDAIIGGESDIKWEGVRVTDAETGASEHFFHMRFAKQDTLTSRGEVKEFVRFADHLGAQDADERDVQPVGSNWLTRLFSSKDDTTVKADVYFSSAGVQRRSAGRSEGRGDHRRVRRARPATGRAGLVRRRRRQRGRRAPARPAQGARPLQSRRVREGQAGRARGGLRGRRAPRGARLGDGR